ncbi:hypothetical protein RAAC3_TM7C00001G0602 [Candidatus Saccharibacteria bacterium RAAC3_TM7_1]|nr:hypothetical protein RAAC3_TM7C00001G0602 [Candidatus Saccharibacteria bacterium RAAC3_TM7_1]HCZ28403.1 hypothetical protein [Candidatus Saccharibacteria bacterium]
MQPTLHSWNGVLWRIKNSEVAFAHCPTHQGIQLDILSNDGRPVDQARMKYILSSTRFVCPMDNKMFSIENDYFTLRRRVIAITKSEAYKDAKIIDIDNIYTPILRVAPKPKDDRYSVQVEIDETPNGKKLVIYAIDRKNPDEKTQIFIDPQFDKISFDGRGDLHPNMIFSKVIAYFKDEKKATLERKED